MHLVCTWLVFLACELFERKDEALFSVYTPARACPWVTRKNLRLNLDHAAEAGNSLPGSAYPVPSSPFL